MTLGKDNIGARLDTEKDREFRCPKCRARCTQSPTDDNTEYGHMSGCPDRPDEWPAGGKYLKNCDHVPAQQVATDGGRQ